MRTVLLLGGIFLWLAGGAVAADGSGLSSLVDDLKDVEAEMTANQGRIEALQAEIGQLQALGKDAADEILRLQALEEEHSQRVRQLGEKYGQVLALAERQRADLDRATGWNWALGGIAVVAVVVVIGEGLALAGR